jgi:hypothetical protein
MPGYDDTPRALDGVRRRYLKLTKELVTGLRDR